jgi:DNA-binding MarR family transcriptional regulator
MIGKGFAKAWVCNQLRPFQIIDKGGMGNMRNRGQGSVCHGRLSFSWGICMFGGNIKGKCCATFALVSRYVNMAVLSRSAHDLNSPAASPLFLREDEVRRGVELLYFGYTRLTQTVDDMLSAHGLGRAHHRALYFIARQPNLTVSALLRILKITKQSLGRVLNDLADHEFLETRTGETDRRQKLLRLTAKGDALEAQLFDALKRGLSHAYASAGQESVTGFWRVLEGLIPEEERAMVMELQKGQAG